MCMKSVDFIINHAKTNSKFDQSVLTIHNSPPYFGALGNERLHTLLMSVELYSPSFLLVFAKTNLPENPAISLKKSF